MDATLALMNERAFPAIGRGVKPDDLPGGGLDGNPAAIRGHCFCRTAWRGSGDGRTLR